MKGIFRITFGEQSRGNLTQNKYSRYLQKLAFDVSGVFVLWGEQDSNLRRFPNGFTVRPRWPLEYLPSCGSRLQI